MPYPPDATNDRPARRPTTTIPELDSLRGVAIALVVLMHAEGIVNFRQPQAPDATIPLVRALLIAGHTGVSLFFVLSAFLLARPFLAEIAGGPVVDRGRYFLRRFWRIVPLYALAVVLTTFIVAQQPADLLRGLPYLFFLNFTVSPDARIAPFVSGVWWSLATEWQFYLLLPLLPLAFRSRRTRLICALLAATYVAAYVAYIRRGWSMPLWLSFNVRHTLFGRAPVFACGIAAAFVYERWGRRIRAWATRTRWVYAWGADAAFFALIVGMLAALGSLMATYTYVTLEVQYPAWHLAEGAAWATVLLFCLLAPVRTRAIMRGGRLRELGQISYSVYLLHEPLLVGGFYGLRMLWPRTFDGWNVATAAGVAALGAIIVAAARMLYRNIEAPLMWQDRPIPAPVRAAQLLEVRRPAAAEPVPAAAWDDDGYDRVAAAAH